MVGIRATLCLDLDLYAEISTFCLLWRALGRWEELLTADPKHFIQTVFKPVIIVTNQQSPWTLQLTLHCSSQCIKATMTGNAELSPVLKVFQLGLNMGDLLIYVPGGSDTWLSPPLTLQQMIWRRKPPLFERYCKTWAHHQTPSLPPVHF